MVRVTYADSNTSSHNLGQARVIDVRVIKAVMMYPNSVTFPSMSSARDKRTVLASASASSASPHLAKKRKINSHAILSASMANANGGQGHRLTRTNFVTDHKGVPDHSSYFTAKAIQRQGWFQQD